MKKRIEDKWICLLENQQRTPHQLLFFLRYTRPNQNRCCCRPLFSKPKEVIFLFAAAVYGRVMQPFFFKIFAL